MASASATVLAAGMNAESRWHKSTFGRLDRDGLHPPGLFSNEKKQGRDMLRKKTFWKVHIPFGSFLVVVHIFFGFQKISLLISPPLSFLQYFPLPILERAGVSLERLAAPL